MLTCTDNCPTQPFKVQAGLGERLCSLTYIIPDMELFIEFMNSIKCCRKHRAEKGRKTG